MRKNTHAETHSAKALRRLAASAVVLLAVCLVLMTPVSASIPANTNWYTGDPNDGTETNPYVITTAAQLFGLAQLVNEQTSQQFPSGTYIQLGDDIDLQNEPWTPIGWQQLEFTGHFDGNGKTISGLNVSEVHHGHVGLFGIMSGSVTNLTVIGKVDVINTGNSGVVTLYAGGIAGVNDGGFIAGSSFRGPVKATNFQVSETVVGGITGVNAGTIRDCYTTDAVTANGDVTFAGGIAGGNGKSILNCYATGAVSANGAVAYAGGIVGENNSPPRGSAATIENCYALNEAVTASGQSAAFAARVVGSNTVTQGALSPSQQIPPVPTELSGTNYGWKHMQPTSLVQSPSGDSDILNSWNAADCCAADIQSASWDSTNIWTMAGRGNYKLPVLTNSNTNPSETPAHLLVTVNFNAGTATATPNSQKVLDGAKVTQPTLTSSGNPVNAEGWYKEPAFTTKWIFDQFIVCPPNFTLYANWTSTDTGDDDSGEGNGGDNTGGNDTGGDNTVPGIPPANNNNGGGGGGSEGTYDTFPRNTDENGDADFGKSPVVIRIDLPEDTDTAVTLITNPETPETPDTEDTDVYYEFELDIPDYPEETEGDVIWRIPKSLLNDEFGADDYGVYVYDEDEWKPLDSVWEEGDGNYLHYTTKITGDGNFIIVKEKGISKKAGDDTPVTVPEDKPQDTPGTVLPPSSGTETPDEEEQEIPILGIGIGLFILILVIAGIVFAVSRRK